jgi:hypothetical protein
MSGDITIVTGKGELDVNGDDIIEFVIEHIKREKISQFENMTVKDIIDFFK